jgi:hypothetical protein
MPAIPNDFAVVVADIRKFLMPIAQKAGAQKFG